jgi:D-alanyl-D-alanine carboxypeptidase
VNLPGALDGLGDVPAVVAGISQGGTREVAGRGASESSGFRIASLTKAFTSAAFVLAAHERGVPLDTPAISLLPDLAPDWNAGRELTVGQILGQVTGLRETVTAADVASLPLIEAARLVVRAGSRPGAGWSYYNGNYFLAGAILAALDGGDFETALSNRLLDPWKLSATTFATPPETVPGWDGGRKLPPIDYPRSRRPSGGLWSTVPDLLTLGERLIGDHDLLAAVRTRQTPEQDPMAYGLGWALGPGGQMYLNGRLPGYRAAMLLVPGRQYVSVILTSRQQALPAAAKVLSDLQKPLTGHDLSSALDDFAA